MNIQPLSRSLSRSIMCLAAWLGVGIGIIGFAPLGGVVERSGVVDVRAVASGGAPGWTHAGLCKTRYDGNNDGLWLE